MSLHESVIEAARIHNELAGSSEAFAVARARRVILALAENLPEDAVEKARQAYRIAWDVAQNTMEIDSAMDDAIVAFLKHVGETP